MSIEESDPFAGYGIWSSPSTAEQRRVDLDDEYDENCRFELVHELRGTNAHHRKISRFSTLDEAVLAGKVLGVLLPKEYDADENWHWSPRLEVWERDGTPRLKVHSCADDSELIATFVDGLKSFNAKLRDLRTIIDEHKANINSAL